jgi:hypothetical protein
VQKDHRVLKVQLVLVEQKDHKVQKVQLVQKVQPVDKDLMVNKD